MKRPSEQPAPTASFSTFLHAVTGERADAMLVELAGAAMAAKLAKKREDGRGGWHLPDPAMDANLRKALREHLDKGDMVDVLNLAAMIHVRGELHGQAAPAKKAAPAAKKKAVAKTAKKKPAAKKPAPTRRSTAKPASTADELKAIVEKAKPLFKKNPALTREELIKAIGRRYERLTTMDKLRKLCAGEIVIARAPATPAPTGSTPPAAKPKKEPARKTAPAPKGDTPAKDTKGPWSVKAKGKTLGATILEKKPGDPYACSAGQFTVVSVDTAKREIQVEPAGQKPAAEPQAPKAETSPPAGEPAVDSAAAPTEANANPEQPA
jgi:hypothetical protein